MFFKKGNLNNSINVRFWAIAVLILGIFVFAEAGI